MGLLTDIATGGGSKLVSRMINKRRQGAKSSGSASMPSQEDAGDYPSYKRGGRVRKTGLARLHKGEMVIPARRARRGRGKR